MFETKNVLKRVSVFRKIVRLRYQDGSSMVEHINAFQGLTNNTTYLEVPLDDKVLTLLLLGSLMNSWETLVVTFGNAGPQGKHLTQEQVKSSLLNEEAHRKDKDSIFDSKALVTEGNMNRGRSRNKSLQNRKKSVTRSKSRGRPTSKMTKGESMLFRRRRYRTTRTPRRSRQVRSCCSSVSKTK